MSCSAIFVFPGQGSQHLNMLSKGRIYDSALSSDHSDAVNYCSDLIETDVIKLIEEGPKELLDQTSITQPVLLLCSYLHYHEVKQKINLSPYCMAGHSLGEYTALVAANSLSIISALKLVRKRGVLMETSPSGSMAAILGMNADLIDEICKTVSMKNNLDVQCANLNSPLQTVISGNNDAVEEVQALCLENGAKRTIKLKVSIASHSSLMKPIINEFSKHLNEINFSLPEVPLYHNTTCSTAQSVDELKDSLAQQLHSPVRWVDTCNKILLHDHKYPIIECGPGKVLTGLCKANNLPHTYLSSSDVDFYEKMNKYGK